MTPLLPRKKYRVIYADPAWDFENYSEKGEDRNANQHYQCMSLEDIKRLPVVFCADADCVLLMWTTGPFLEKAFEVIHAWGFEYKTIGFNWMKENKKSPGLFMGPGYWTRSNSEICLLATVGSPERQAADVMQAILEPRREHSRKPDCVYGRIERLLQGPYLELFARNTRQGWESWGNETDKYGMVPA